VPSMFERTGGQQLLQIGALDGLDGDAISRLAPTDAEHPLVTRLRDGTEVVVAKERITPLMEEAVSRLEEAGSTLVCVLCTGEFNLPSVRARVIYPDRVLLGVVDALLPQGAIGIIIPHAGQSASMIRKWSTAARTVEIAVYSPYDAESNIASAAERLIASNVELIVLDCMGYTRQMQREAQIRSDIPVILANRMVGAVLEALTVDD
jgi:protein AroM